MRKLLLCLCCALVSVSVYAKTVFKKGDTLYVSVRSTVLKSSSGSFAKTTGTVVYGDAVIVVESGSKKTLVRMASGQNAAGWIANGSLTKKKIIKRTDGSTVRASSDELALAGKGFSEEAENAFKAKNPNADYAEVDEVEKSTVSDSDRDQFMAQGGLHEISE